MNYFEFLDKIISDGIEAAAKDYKGLKRAGALAGFNACKGKSPKELKDLLDASNTATEDARKRKVGEQYWWFRCYAAEVEWVCNCVSAILWNQGLEVIIPPTTRGVLKAAQVVAEAERE